MILLRHMKSCAVQKCNQIWVFVQEIFQKNNKWEVRSVIENDNDLAMCLKLFGFSFSKIMKELMYL